MRFETVLPGLLAMMTFSAAACGSGSDGGLLADSGSQADAASSNAGGDAGGGYVSDAGAQDAGIASPDAGPLDDLLGVIRETSNHGQSANTLAGAQSVSGLFVAQDPTIDPSRTAVENAVAIAAQLRSSTSSCTDATVQYTSGSNSVSLAVSPKGCAISGVGTISGTVSAAVSEGQGTVTVAFTFNGFEVNGSSLSGQLSLATNNGTQYQVIANLTSSSRSLSYSGTIAFDSDGRGVTLNGSGTDQYGNDPPGSYSMSKVHTEIVGCYANTGTVAVTQTVQIARKATTQTEYLYFSNATPSTGQVKERIGGAETTTTLPVYAQCPSALVGEWFLTQPARTFLLISQDGHYELAASDGAISGDPSEAGTWTGSASPVTFKASVGSCVQSSPSAIYGYNVLNGNLSFSKVSDACSSRGTTLLGGLWRPAP